MRRCGFPLAVLDRMSLRTNVQVPVEVFKDKISRTCWFLRKLMTSLTIQSYLCYWKCFAQSCSLLLGVGIAELLQFSKQHGLLIFFSLFIFSFILLLLLLPSFHGISLSLLFRQLSFSLSPRTGFCCPMTCSHPISTLCLSRVKQIALQFCQVGGSTHTTSDFMLQ